jgi:hypothetical protein
MKLGGTSPPLLSFFLIVLSAQDRGIFKIGSSDHRKRLDMVGFKISPGQLARTFFTGTLFCCVPEYAPLFRTKGAFCIFPFKIGSMSPQMVS